MENQLNDTQLEALKQIQSGAISEDQLDFVGKMLAELKADLLGEFKRRAEQNGTTEDKIQLALRFKDLPDNTGYLYYQVMLNWKPLRVANFNRDFLGQEGAAAMFPDESGKENFIKIYVLGMPMLHLPGALEKVANKYNVPKWSMVSGVFHRKADSNIIKFTTYCVIDGKNKDVDSIDIFAAEGEEGGMSAKEVQTVDSSIKHLGDGAICDDSTLK